MFSSLARRLKTSHDIVVPYPAQPKLPNGATCIQEHTPLAKAELVIEPRDLRLTELTANAPYSSFTPKHSTEQSADALVLDALIETLYPHGNLARSAERALIPNFYGQIFFLGTVFDTAHGPCYPFFNWSSAAPVGRYLCPVGNPVRWDVPVYAAVYKA
ncbi:hypothetical protein N9L26_01040 [Candidatus Pacebacteria bacterium]|nr:hypothetical protein [Candidatus Paceibacterota bacterium]